MKKTKGLPKYLSAAIIAGMHIDPFLFQTNQPSKKKKRRKIKAHR